MKRRIEEGDSFLRKIIERGKALHEKVDRGVGDQTLQGLK